MSVRANRSVASSILEFRLSQSGFFLVFEGKQAKGEHEENVQKDSQEKAKLGTQKKLIENINWFALTNLYLFVLQVRGAFDVGFVCSAPGLFACGFFLCVYFLLTFCKIGKPIGKAQNPDTDSVFFSSQGGGMWHSG